MKCSTLEKLTGYCSQWKRMEPEFSTSLMLLHKMFRRTLPDISYCEIFEKVLAQNVFYSVHGDLHCACDQKK